LSGKERELLKKIISFAMSMTFLIVTASAAFSWPADGIIPGTDLEFSSLEVSREGVSVKLTNTSGDDVKVSLRLTFYDRESNAIGYSLFGLREIPAGSSIAVSRNYLNGKWKPCRDAPKGVFQKMTYEPIYY
jgi:hypothetical protein